MKATMTKLLLGMKLLWSTHQVVVYAQTTSTPCTRALSSPLSLENGQVTIEQVKNTDEGTFTIRITAEEDAWIGIGINLDGRAKMTPTQAIIGRVEDETSGLTSVWKYRLASDDEDASGVIRLTDELQVDLVNATFVQDGMSSILEFTHPLADIAGDMVVTDNSFWVFGVGLPGNVWMGKHKISGGFQMSLTDNCIDSTSSSSPGSGSDTESGSNGIVPLDTESAASKNLFLAHGICMALAWGLFVPLAIGASLIRSMSCLDKGTWFSVHLYSNNLAVLLTIVGFALAVVATSQNEDDHFTENAHTKAGLSIFLLVLVQALIGYTRPPAPKAPAPSSTNDKNTDDIVVDDTMRQPQHTPPIRLVWEIGHRLIGLVLLGLAWYNCTSGIELHAEDYAANEDSADLWIGLFWAVAGGITSMVLVVYILQRLRGSTQ